METIQKILDFIWQEQFLLGCGAGVLFWMFVAYIYMQWYKTKTIVIDEIAYDDLLMYALDPNQPTSVRIKLLYVYSRHAKTTLEDLYYLGYEFPDPAFEKNPKVMKIIEYARQQVLKHKPFIEKN